MSVDVVKYNNEFNLMPMPELLAREMDIFMLALSKFNFEGREIEFDAYEFFKSLKEPKDSYCDLFKIFDTFSDKILNFKIKYKNANRGRAFVCFESFEMDFNTNQVKITAQKDFYNLIVNYNLGYTRFELVEFANLTSKYTKMIYRLLKQFRTTGKAFFKWEFFLDFLKIPKTYMICDIDKQILKPALQELSKEQNLFDSVRTPFENLKYNKVKDKGRGRGGKVIGIEFTFKPQKADKKLLESSIKSSNAEKMFETWDILQTYNFTSSHKNFENLGIFSVGSCERLSTHIEVDFIGENKKIKLKFESAEQLQNAIKGFKIHEN